MEGNDFKYLEQIVKNHFRFIEYPDVIVASWEDTNVYFVLDTTANTILIPEDTRIVLRMIETDCDGYGATTRLTGIIKV